MPSFFLFLLASSFCCLGDRMPFKWASLEVSSSIHCHEHGKGNREQYLFLAKIFSALGFYWPEPASVRLRQILAVCDPLLMLFAHGSQSVNFIFFFNVSTLIFFIHFHIKMKRQQQTCLCPNPILFCFSFRTSKGSSKALKLWTSRYSNKYANAR